MVALGVGGGGSGCHDKEAIMGKKELGKENNIFLFKVTVLSSYMKATSMDLDKIINRQLNQQHT